MSPPRNQTLVEALTTAQPDKPFITAWEDVDDVYSVTFGEFLQLARLRAASLRAHGLRRDDRVILIMPQGIPLMATFASVMLLGAVPAILAYPNFKADPVKYSGGLAGVSANLKARLVVVDDAFPDSLFDYVAMGEQARIVRLTDGLTSSEPPVPDIVVEPRSLAFIQHSAGTTGLQKGVALTHGAVLRQLDHLAAALGLEARDRIYSWLPLYHDMGLIAAFMLPMVYQIPVVMQSPVDWVIRPGTMLQLISDYRCTLSWVPNFALQFLARRVPPEDRPDYDLRSLRALINCSEPVRAQSMDEFATAYRGSGLGADVLKSSYAMAENVFAVTQSPVDSAPHRIWIDHQQLLADRRAVETGSSAKGGVSLVSSGQCLAGNEVRIASPAGTDLPDGRVGEIVIRSDSLFDGYYNRPESTAKVLHEGWYRSGDLGFRVNKELYVLGRDTDLIIVAGKNIHPQDVEEIVCRHPAIHDGRAVALGVFNEELGTEDIVVAAEVNREEDLADDSHIERSLREAIVAELDITVRRVYLKPQRWIVKSTAGKPARSTTRAKLLAEHPELVRDVQQLRQER